MELNWINPQGPGLEPAKAGLCPALAGSASSSQVTSSPGLWPSFLPGSPLPDSRQPVGLPAGSLLSAGSLPECWAGQPAPPGSCLQSSSVPCPGDWRTLTPVSVRQMDRFHPGHTPLSREALGWGSVGDSTTRASWLPAGSGARAWLWVSL